MRTRRRTAGMTLVEIMVSVALVGVVAALLLGVQVRLTAALRDQQAISEEQQTLRAAAAVLVKDLRQAGYLAVDIHTNVAGDPLADVPSVQVLNGADGAPDILHLQYADDSLWANVSTKHPFNSAESVVDNAVGFHDGDVVLAVHTIQPKLGWGCVLMITHDPQLNGGGGDKLQHNPGQGAPWNAPGNSQCNDIATTWNDGYTAFTRVHLRGYRIKPDDARGVLQLSESQGARDDWQDIALGIVDLQLAVRVYQPGDTEDVDGDGDPERDWYSGDDMAGVLGLKPSSQLLMVSVTLVAKTTKGLSAPIGVAVPSLKDAAYPDRYNRQSDRGEVPLPVADPTSRYHGDVVFRVYTTTVDLRNVGVGIDAHG